MYLAPSIRPHMFTRCTFAGLFGLQLNRCRLRVSSAQFLLLLGFLAMRLCFCQAVSQRHGTWYRGQSGLGNAMEQRTRTIWSVSTPNLANPYDQSKANEKIVARCLTITEGPDIVLKCCLNEARWLCLISSRATGQMTSLCESTVSCTKPLLSSDT